MFELINKCLNQVTDVLLVFCFFPDILATELYTRFNLYLFSTKQSTTWSGWSNGTPINIFEILPISDFCLWLLVTKQDLECFSNTIGLSGIYVLWFSSMTMMKRLIDSSKSAKIVENIINNLYKMIRLKMFNEKKKRNNEPRFEYVTVLRGSQLVRCRLTFCI